MRIPKLLISLHQRIKNTRAWKRRWKITAFSPFLLAGLIYGGYAVYNHSAERAYQQFVTSWENRGETLDINALFPEPENLEKDFFSHAAVIDEINKPRDKRLSPLYRMGVPGITTNSRNYNNPGQNGTHAMGMPRNVRLWLDPAEPGISERQAAIKCLNLIAPVSKRLDALSEASKRPRSYFSRGFNEDGAMTDNGTMLQRFNISRCTSLFGDRALLLLLAEKETEAAEDMQTILRVWNHFSQDHSLVGYLISAAHLSSLESPLWEGLRIHAWSDESLAAFEAKLSAINKHEHFLKAMRQEMAYTNLIIQALNRDPEFLEKQMMAATSGSSTPKTWKERGQKALQKIKPRGWYLKRGTAFLRIYEQELFYPNGSRCEKLSIAQVRKMENIKNPLHDPVYDVFGTSDDSMSIYAKQIGRALKNQASIHNMRTAIAIERYYLKHGKYPATLHDLVPSFLPGLLEDVITGGPLNYRIKADGTPLIYSIGYNAKDNDGQPNRETEKGDWAWMYSPPSGFTFSDYMNR